MAWSAQAEVQFALRDITADTTKYYYVVAALSSLTVGRMVSILENPPEQDKYGALKSHLLKTFGHSDSEGLALSVQLFGLYFDHQLLQGRACQISGQLSQHGLIVNPTKCQFGLTTNDFLGHRITSDRAVPLPSITSFPRPAGVSGHGSFLRPLHPPSGVVDPAALCGFEGQIR